MPEQDDRDTPAQKGLGLTRALIAACAALALLGACHKAVAPRPAAQPPAQSDYAAPPEVTQALPGPGGGLTLRGVAQPQSRVRLASPDGTAAGTTAGMNGAWSLNAPAVDQPRLLSLSEDEGGRLIRARGYLAMLPGGAVAMLRPTTGARPLIGPTSTPRIGAVDFDAAGAGVVSGRAHPDRPVRVLLDGQDAGEGRTDSQGWFDVSLSDNLKPGVHAVTVGTPDGRADARFEGSAPRPIASPPMNAARLEQGWRLDWMSPGGGVQSTILFDASAPAWAAGVAGSDR
jgi:hypothetical protein